MAYLVRLVRRGRADLGLIGKRILQLSAGVTGEGTEMRCRSRLGGMESVTDLLGKRRKGSQVFMMTPDILGSDDWVYLFNEWLLRGLPIGQGRVPNNDAEMLGRLANRVYSGIRVLRPGLCDWAVECR